MNRILALLLILAPTAALAHPGLATGGLAGVLHPLTGADHLLAMVGIGVWATQQTKHPLALPVTFLTAMAAGFIASSLGLTLPAIAPIILASVILLGAATAMTLRAPLTVVLPFNAVFGLAHGAAHANEGAGPGFALGMISATAALHLIGVALGLTLNRAAVRLAGATTLLAGLGFAWAR